MIVGIVSRHNVSLALKRQALDGRFWGESEFEIGRKTDCFALVVYDEFATDFVTNVPIERRLLMLSEPPEVKSYNSDFANQFGVLVSPYPISGYRGRWVQSHTGLPWFFGLTQTLSRRREIRYDLQQLQTLQPPTEKLNRVSVVCSTRTTVPRHRDRLNLIAHLRTAFPDRIDVFGHGFQSIPDKADAILPYRYHIVLENNEVPHFWTEKTADAYLGFALPLFSGCPNISTDFEPGSMVVLPPIKDVAAVTEVLQKILQTDPYQEHLPAICRARERLISEHNLWALLARIVNSLPVSPPQNSRPVRMRPARDFKNLAGIIRKLERLVTFGNAR